MVSAIPVEDALVFKNPTNKRLEAHSRAWFSLAGPAIQPSSTMTLICQTLADWSKAVRRDLSTLAIGPFAHGACGTHACSLELQFGWVIEGLLPHLQSDSSVSEHEEDSVGPQSLHSKSACIAWSLRDNAMGGKSSPEKEDLELSLGLLTPWQMPRKILFVCCMFSVIIRTQD